MAADARDDGDDTPRSPTPPTPSTVRRVGGGYEWTRSERYTEAMTAAAAYNCYRALPCDGAALTATDVALLAEILKAAEAELDAGGSGGAPAQQASARRVAGLAASEAAPQRCLVQAVLSQSGLLASEST